MRNASPAAHGQGDIVLAIRDLRVAFHGLGGPAEALSGVSLHVRRGEKVALVGESGSGKSTIARLVLGLLQDHAAEISGSALLGRREIAAYRGLPARDAGRRGLEARDTGGSGPEASVTYIRGVRGDRVTMIFQDPVSALNPTFTIGDQFREVLRRRDPALSRSEANVRARAALADVYLHEPDRVLDSYVFQLSGGMSQRVMIALALVNDPELLVADEPGSSLDVTVQARTLHLMDELIRRHGTSVLFISHNLGVVREFADRVYVIYRGRIVEHASVAQLFTDARHPYTRALLAAIPKINQAAAPDAPETSPDFTAPLIVHPGCAEPTLAPA
jgi:ABC-type dipeptide/oligopeptide/nickel transport system ATPase component